MKSDAWHFFTKPPGKRPLRIKCKYCTFAPMYTGPTTMMIRHVKVNHEKEWKAIRKEQRNKQYVEDTSTNVQESANRWLTKAVATGNIPFNFVSNKEFRTFCNLLNDKFKVPSPRQIRNSMESLNANYISFMAKKLENIHDFVLITDGYSDLSSDKHFYSCHIIFVDESYKRNTCFIGIQYVPSGATEDVSIGLSKVLSRVNVDFTQCQVTVTDAGSNVKCLSESHLIPNLHCSCHLINLIFKDFEASCKTMRVLLAHAKEVAKILSRKRAVREEVKSVSLKSDPLPRPMCPTRWAGSYLILRAYHAQYQAISAVIGHLLKPNQIQVLQDIIRLLEPLFNVMKKMESDESFATEIVPLLAALSEKCGSESPRAKCLSSIIKKRLDSFLDQNEYIRIALVLDPRYAFLPRIADINWRESENLLKKLYEDDEFLDSENDDPDVDDDDLMSNFIKNRAEPKIRSTFNTEMLAYKSVLSNSRPSHNSNPLGFWHSQSENFASLSMLAKKYLAPPASSSASERIFSKCSDIVRQKKRSRISVEAMNSMLLTVCLTKKENSDDEISDEDVEEERSESDEENDATIGEEWEDYDSDEERNDSREEDTLTL